MMVEMLANLEKAGNDVVVAKERLMNNEELYVKCLKLFMVDENHANLKTAMAEANYQNAFSASHALKGTSGNLGLSDYYHYVSLLSDGLKNNDTSNAETYYEEIERAYKELETIIV
ncbi:HPt (histidine-containing phosphotransfer) domain-containing protein [Clostridiales Family XIII bacterium PM5-7]